MAVCPAVRRGGSKLAVTPAGRPERERSASWEKPSVLERVTAEAADCPRSTERESGEALSVKLLLGRMVSASAEVTLGRSGTVTVRGPVAVPAGTTNTRLLSLELVTGVP